MALNVVELPKGRADVETIRAAMLDALIEASKESYLLCGVSIVIWDKEESAMASFTTTDNNTLTIEYIPSFAKKHLQARLDDDEDEESTDDQAG